MDSAQTFGVVYVPESNPQPPSKSLNELLTPSILFVRIQWVDLANTVRIRILPVSYFRRMFSNARSRPENPLRLPRCIEEARKALRSNDDMKEMLGGEFVEKYLSVNETMETTMVGKSEQETLKKIIEYF